MNIDAAYAKAQELDWIADITPDERAETMAHLRQIIDAAFPWSTDMNAAPIGKQVLVKMPVGNARVSKAMGNYQVAVRQKTAAADSYVWLVGGMFAWDVGMPIAWRELLP